MFPSEGLKRAGAIREDPKHPVKPGGDEIKLQYGNGIKLPNCDGIKLPYGNGIKFSYRNGIKLQDGYGKKFNEIEPIKVDRKSLFFHNKFH